MDAEILVLQRIVRELNTLESNQQANILNYLHGRYVYSRVLPQHTFSPYSFPNLEIPYNPSLPYTGTFRE